MKNIIVILLLLCPMTSWGQSQRKQNTFEITVDTISINLKDYMKPAVRAGLTHAVKHNDKYYCFFNEIGLYYFTRGGNHFFIIAENGEIEHQVEVPTEFETGSYFDLFVRNDSIILKDYYRKGTYSLDLLGLKWDKIEDADDVIYEDDDYYVTYLDFGEWGDATWFKNKHTAEEYALASSGTIVNRVEGSYFITTPYRISQIENPSAMKPCGAFSYKATKENNDYAWSSSLNGTKVIYGDSIKDYRYVWDDDTPSTSIITSFTHNNELFHLCMDSVSTYVARLGSNRLVKVQDVCIPLSVFHWDNSYRYKIQKDNSQLLKFSTGDNNLYGLVEIQGSKINVRYIKHDIDSMRHLGTDGFSDVFNYVISHIDNLPLSEIDSIERKIGGVDLKSFREGALHESYYPTKNNFDFVGGKSFLKTIDSLISNETVYYFTKKDSLVKVVFLEWTETQPYKNSDERRFFREDTKIFTTTILQSTETYNKSSERQLHREGNRRSGLRFQKIREENDLLTDRFQNKWAEIERILTAKLGKSNGKIAKPNGIYEQTWQSANGFRIDVYYGDFKSQRQIRMVIYKD